MPSFYSFITMAAEESQSLLPPSKTAGLNIPVLPQSSPEAFQPQGLKLPLRKHQLRALNRCLVIESNDNDGASSLNTGFGHRYEFTSRGGCLADQVGTGKTATTIGLVLSGEGEGDTLVVAPKHLIPQWKHEIEKFSDLDVLCGVEEFLRRGSYPPISGKTNRRIVLVDVDSVLKQERLWYDFRRVWKDGKEITRKLDAATKKTYITAAQFSVKSPKGPCTYIGWLYIGGLHIPQRPWRRVVYDEIQDLVQSGTESQKCLLQLSRTARNVWLLSATPFPHGNQSVKANHELLGFCRMQLDVESEVPLPSYHPFEKIKRKLYIKSPPQVADQAVSVKVTHQTQCVQRLDTERRFYNLEKDKLLANRREAQTAVMDGTIGSWLFHPDFDILRQMTVHPEANSELRKVFSSQRNSKQTYTTRNISSSVEGAARRAIRDARERLRVLQAMNPQQMERGNGDIRYSIKLAKKVINFRESTPLLSNVFEGGIDSEKIEKRRVKLKNLIYDHYLGGRVAFRVIGNTNDNTFGQPEFLRSVEDVFFYFENELGEGKKITIGHGWQSMLSHYLVVTKRTLDGRTKVLREQQKENQELKLRIETLSHNNNGTTSENSNNNTISINNNNSIESDDLAQKHGSKPAALVRHLRQVVFENHEQVIVFSYWHDTLKLIQQTLRHCGLPAVFCDGDQTSRALSEFTSSRVPIILLSAQSKASGANLQCATHVILLDPAGSSAQHGAALEEQAIGRAVRMGQERPVTITRFCSKGTLEEELFRQIDHAKKAKRKKASDLSYVIQDSSKVMKTKTIIESSKSEEEEGLVDEGGVEVTATLTEQQRWTKNLQQAEAKGQVVVLVDDDDDDSDDDQAAAKTTSPTSVLSAVVTPSSGGPIRVKTEFGEKRNALVTTPSSDDGPIRIKTTELGEKRKEIEHTSFEPTTVVVESAPKRCRNEEKEPKQSSENLVKI